MRISYLVETILRDLPKSRDSDRYLELVVWHKLGLELTPEQRAKFMELPSSESITRVRRKIQEQGKYRATDHVSRERRIKSLIMQQNAPTAKPERLDSLMQERLV